MNRPRTVYFNGINLSGLWSRRPLKGTWDPEVGEWFDSEGNLSAKTLGLKIERGWCTYADINRSVVQAWTDGVIAALSLVSRWANLP